MSSEIVETTLGEYLNFKNGKSSPDRDDSFNIPVYGSNGLIGYSEESNAEPNSLIIGRVGSYCGSVYHSNTECWITDNAIIATPENENESYFWYYLLLISNLHNYRSGSGQPLLNQTTLKSISVSIPRDAYHRIEIGEVLNTYDQKIHLNQQTNETLEAMAQAVFKSWFVGFDPVRAKIEAKSAGCDPNRAAMAAIAGISLEQDWDEIEAALDQKLSNMTEEQHQQLSRTAQLFPDELVGSEIGEVPKGWDLKTIDEIADVIDCLHSKKPDRQDQGKLYLEVSNIGDNGNLDLSDKYLINEDDYNQWIKRIEVRKGDMVITKTGRVGALAYIPKGINAAIGRNIVAIRPDPKMINSSFLRDAMLSDFMKREISALTSSGTILQSLHVKAVRKLRLIIPNVELMAIYSESIAEVHGMIAENIFQNESLTGLRDTLLPKLISGEVGV